MTIQYSIHITTSHNVFDKKSINFSEYKVGLLVMPSIKLRKCLHISYLYLRY